MWLLLACAPPDRALEPAAGDPARQRRDREVLVGEMGRMARPVDPPADRPDIVVVVLDTVRADHLGLYGYAGETSPRLDAWARDARVWDDVIADAPWTLPSHASLFTGRSPREHGAHGVPDRVAAPLAPGSATVARALRDAGYLTAGIAANRAFLDRSWGLAQGFALWLCDSLPATRAAVPYPTAERITALAEQFLDRRPPGPVFLFVNYMDAHTPWLPREGYVRDRDAIDRRLLPDGERWPALKRALLADGRLDPAVRRAWTEAYDSALRYLDDQVGTLLDGLAARGIGPEDHVFLLSDHGEYLGEHHLVEHSKDVYDTVLHVPFVHRGPGVAPGRDPTPLQLHDVADHILAAAGLPPLPATRPDPALRVSELYYTRRRELKDPGYAGRFDRIRRSFRLGPTVLVLGSDGSEEAYDLRTDPGQTSPLPGAPWIPAVRAAAETWLAAVPEATPVDEPVHNVEALRALGYMD